MRKLFYWDETKKAALIHELKSWTAAEREKYITANFCTRCWEPLAQCKCTEEERLTLEEKNE